MRDRIVMFNGWTPSGAGLVGAGIRSSNNIQSSICSMLKIIDAICSISCTYVSTVIVNPENENHPLEDLTMLECGSEI